MARYSITSSTFEGAIILGYNDAEYLTFYDNQTDMPPARLHLFLGSFPLHVQQMETFAANSQTLKIKQLQADLSFKAFWTAYDYKVGNKVRAEKLWNKLSDAEKQQAFDTIPKYDYYLLNRGNMEKLYPETFLNQRRFENEYKVEKSVPTR